jgi:hypothetical protein
VTIQTTTYPKGSKVPKGSKIPKGSKFIEILNFDLF